MRFCAAMVPLSCVSARIDATTYQRYGAPNLSDLLGHVLEGNPDIESAAPFEVWLAKSVRPDQVILKSTNARIHEQAVREGAGMRLISVSAAQGMRVFVKVSPALPEWSVKI